MAAPPKAPPKPKRYFFCSSDLDVIDYKDVRLLTRYVGPYGKIDGRRRTGSCAKHQRMVATAIKRSRQAALLPFTVT